MSFASVFCFRSNCHLSLNFCEIDNIFSCANISLGSVFRTSIKLTFWRVKMNKYLVVLGSIVLGASMMTGCSSTDEALNAKVDNLTAKVDQLASDVDSLKADVQTAKDEAARANSRLDNLTTKYKK